MDRDGMDNLLTILYELSGIYEFSDKDGESAGDYYVKFKTIYSDSDFRHSYAELSHFAESQITPDSREQMVENLDAILCYADINFHSEQDIIRRIGKLADHLELENLRLARIEQIKIIGGQVFLEKTEAEAMINANKDMLQNQQDDIRNMNTQMVSLLGIFSAVVIAFFGGMSYFTSAFSNLNNIPLCKALIMASILGLVICDSIYMLLNFILLIIRQDRFLQNKVLSNWTIKLVNVVLLIILIASTFMWIFNFNPESYNTEAETSSIMLGETIDSD